MNQSKFSLADLITLLTAIAFGFACFIGVYFYTLGDTKQSVILAVIIAVLLGGTALGAKLLKRTSRNFKSCFIWEMILLVLFTLLMVFFSYSPFPHYFVVSEQKEEIQSKLRASITQAENMFSEYNEYADNRENLYKSKLQSIVATKNVNPTAYKDFGFVDNNGVSDDKQIENKMFSLNADLFPSNFAQTKLVDSTWLANARKTVDGTFFMGIVGTVNDVEQNSNNWLNELIKPSKVREKGEQTEDFAYNLSFEDVKKHFTTLGSPTLISIGFSVLAYLLMLFSWFVTKRHSRFPGIHVIFGKEKGYIDDGVQL